jgi:uncharacterized protein (TIGR00290 family)
MKTVLLSWSSGKDSAWALHLLRQDPRYEVTGLLTTVNTHFERVAMHSTRRALLEAQASAAGLPLHIVPLPWPCSNAEYEAAMRVALDAALAAGTQAVAFGDLYLEDVRRYREEMLQGTGLTPVFPLWGLPTRSLLETMIDAGLRASVVCLDPAKLPRSFAGRALDREFLRDLPEGIDPCGENGEFHTCVYAGPMFPNLARGEAIPVQTGEVVEREGFVFADLQLAVNRSN